MQNKIIESTKITSLRDHLEDLLDSYRIVDQSEEHGIKLKYTPAEDAHCKVLLMYGDNASGKSLLRRLLGSYFRDLAEADNQRFEHIEVSMRTRTKEGMSRAFMYGPSQDTDNSSGAVSLAPLNGLFNTCADREHGTMASMDEVEIGLSDSYLFALGQYLTKRHIEELHDKPLHKATVIVTHAPELVRGLLEQLGGAPHVMALGDYKNLSLQDWLDGKVPRKTIAELEGLRQLNRDRHRAFEQMFKS